MIVRLLASIGDILGVMELRRTALTMHHSDASAARLERCCLRTVRGADDSGDWDVIHPSSLSDRHPFWEGSHPRGGSK